MPVDNATVTTEVTQILRTVLGDFEPDVPVTAESTFRDDLGMESIDVVALAGRLQARYGGVNFARFVATLDVASVGDLSVGHLVDHIVAELNTPVPAEGAR